MCQDDNGHLICAVSMDLASFFDHLIRGGYVPSERWLQGLELGNEIMGDCEGDNNGTGKGTTIVHQFDVVAKMK